MPKKRAARALAILAAAVLSPAYAEGEKKELLPPPPSGFTQMESEASLTPDEIRFLKQLKWDAKRAMVDPVGEPPKPEVSMAEIDLSPGATPPLVRLSQNEGSSIVFTDIAGQPWPVQNFVNFAPKLTEVTRPIEGGHVLSIEPKTQFGNGNVSVFLVGLPTPVTLTVLLGQRQVDYRVDLRVPKRLAGAPSLPGGTAAYRVDDASFAQAASSDTILVDVIQNTVRYDNVQKTDTSTPDVLAWIRDSGKEKTLLLRTQGILLSPVALDGKKLVSADGTRAYEVRMTPNVTVLLGGKAHNVSVDIEP